MASESTNQIHFLLIPFLAPGHIIPMINIAKLLAQRPNVMATIVTTPSNAVRYASTLQKHLHSGFPVRFLELQFPAAENGLPEGCESADTLPGLHLFQNFEAAVRMLRERLEQCFESLDPRPACILSDKYMLWTDDTATKYKIPRVIFDGMSCFKQLATHHLRESEGFDHHFPASDPFVLPGLPHQIEITRAQLPPEFSTSSFAVREHLQRVRETESRAYGMVINSFEELEHEYVKEFKNLKGGKVWCLGPLSLFKDNHSRGGNDTTDDDDGRGYLKWLDSKESGSVVYVCFGSGSKATPPQLIELGLALEASKSQFVWVVRAGERAHEVEKWLSETGFETRVKDRGLIIRGWAPQVQILSHPSVGGFLTHCGWNSVLEGVSVGVPMITWPQQAEQFLNEKLIVQVLGIGVSVGAPRVGVTVKSGQVKTAIETVMDVGFEGNERRKKAKGLGMLAKKAMEEGGSSHRNLTLFLQDLSDIANVGSHKLLI